MQVIKTELLKSTNWVDLKTKVYIDKAGEQRTWDYLERKKNKEAVVVVPIDIVRKRIMLIKQYRVVVEQHVIEFPAGLIDEGETIAQAAARELEEETGFKGQLLNIGPRVCTSLGITNEIIYMAEMAVNLDDREVQEYHKNQQLENAEEIEVFVCEIDKYLAQLQGWADQGLLIDSKVWAYGIGLANGAHS